MTSHELDFSDTGSNPVGPATQRRPPRHRTTSGSLRIRTRLTLMYSAVFLLGGAALLFVQYLAVDRILGDKSTVVTASPTAPYASAQPTTGLVVPASPLSPRDSTNSTSPLSPPDPNIDASTSTTSLSRATVAARLTDFKALVLNALVAQSLLTLAALVLIAAGLGWWMAGRSLARLHTVTATARRISERNLDGRLALVGPDDEIKELGDTFDAMLARLDRAFAANRRFAANASHELRTPLALQRASLEIPLAEGRVPDDLRPSIERSLRATARSERLVGSLLLLAKDTARTGGGVELRVVNSGPVVDPGSVDELFEPFH
ncbi:MAG TPA: histidine kinase dimerization/phospho-acceptor domain-containing protein, partial [Yinghuangia sp.]|nr:histidine kinase dimerization/phospho-acceptor domain-containing protein [Yinghuangia sp.]